MYKTHVSLLKDPQTKKPFKLLSFKNNASEIIDGLLISNNNWYPIISGVPRVLLGSLRHDYLINHAGFYKKYLKKFPKQCTNEWRDLLKSQISVSAESHHQLITGSSFAYEWESIYRENNYEQQNYLHFLSPYVKAKDLKGKKILDLGCGSGRFTKQASLLGANISVGVDVGESVDTAYKMCRFLDNVLIVQADIYNLPFENSFDIAQSIGVLHHLPNPKAGFLSCPKVLVKNGRMVIWVYNRRNNARALYFYEPLRSLTRRLPKPLLYKICYIPGAIVHLINIITKNMKNPPFGYYRNFPFNMKLNDAFDVLSTPKSNYYFVEQIIDWFKSAQLKNIKAFEHPEAGITCTALK
jgi:SAM-dependent methyltransferase/uncharacterized protein YbaR (Trm112 family)